MSDAMPKIEWIGGSKPYKLVEAFTFKTSAGEFTVPAGYCFDGASVPRIPFVYARYGGRGLEAACLHDFLYEYQLCSRKDADLAFLEMMERYDNPESPAARKTMYYAVRAFGWTRWS